MPSVNAKHQRRKRASQRALACSFQLIDLLDSSIFLLHFTRFDELSKVKVLASAKLPLLSDLAGLILRSHPPSPAWRLLSFMLLCLYSYSSVNQFVHLYADITETLRAFVSRRI